MRDHFIDNTNEIDATTIVDQLEVFMSDLDLVLNNKKVFFAIDFFDIVSQAYPYNILFNKDISFERQFIARDGVFNIINKLYGEKLILLPPYASEALDFFDMVKKNILHFMDFDKESLNKHATSIISKLKNGDDFFTFIEKEIFFLCIIYSPSFITKLRSLKTLLRTNTTSDPRSLHGYGEHISRLRNKKNPYFMRFMRESNVKRTLPNIRDSKALQYIVELNKLLGNDGIIILISSSAIFDSFKSAREFSKTFDKNMFYIRGLEFFYLMILELIRIYGRGDMIFNKNYKFNYEEIGDMFEQLNHDLNEFRQISYIGEHSHNDIDYGRMSRRYNFFVEEEKDYLLEIKKSFDRRERSLLMTYVKDMPKKNLKDLRNVFSDEVINSLNNIRVDLSTDNFLNELSKRLEEVKKETVKTALWAAKQNAFKGLLTTWLRPTTVYNNEEFETNKSDAIYLNKVLGIKDPFQLVSPAYTSLTDEDEILFDLSRENKYVYLVSQIECDEIYQVDIKKLCEFLRAQEAKHEKPSKNLKMILNIVTDIISNQDKIQYQYIEDIINLLAKLKGFELK